MRNILIGNLACSEIRENLTKLGAFDKIYGLESLISTGNDAK
jgi:hypothetical protein